MDVKADENNIVEYVPKVEKSGRTSELIKNALPFSERYEININIPEKTKPFFLPKEYWTDLKDAHQNDFYPVEMLSQVRNGSTANGFPYTRSPYYKAPYFLVFKSNYALTSNFLIFNDFLKPNSYTTVLALLTYDDDNDKFVPMYTSDIELYYHHSLSLNNILEFYVQDSNQNRVEFANLSQLFVSLTIMS